MRLELMIYWLMKPVFHPLDYSAMVRVAKTAYVYSRFNDKPSMPTNASLDLMVEDVGIEPTQNTGLQPVALPTELTLHMGAGVGFEPTLDELMRLVSLPIGLSR